jgi:hypothetical protein
MKVEHSSNRLMKTFIMLIFVATSCEQSIFGGQDADVEEGSQNEVD